ncbi:MAG: thioesterase family protein [Candidatus Nezhaarchaeales archaeon]
MSLEALNLSAGLRFSKKYNTSSLNSARYMGSGDVDVLATPAMIAFMENACLTAVEDKLPEGFTTVGTLVNVTHTAAVPVGVEIEVRGTLLSVNGRRLTFWVEAWWNNKKIGQGVHERVVVNRVEFLNRLKT